MRLCECGCGQPAPIAAKTRSTAGHLRGEPVRFISGHNRRGRAPRLIGTGGYVIVLAPEHPRANRAGYVFEHVLLAERALGRALPAGAVVHHVNGDRTDNRAENLVLCPDRAYHNRIHQRARALVACGRADWLACVFCGTHDDPARMISRGRGRYAHRECRNAYNRSYHRRLAAGRKETR